MACSVQRSPASAAMVFVSQASFTYAGASQAFTVSGNDDTFVFVAGQLVANLGGALMTCVLSPLADGPERACRPHVAPVG